MRYLLDLLWMKCGSTCLKLSEVVQQGYCYPLTLILWYTTYPFFASLELRSI